MSDLTTIARPYAKAAFDFAVEHSALPQWSEMLMFASEVANHESMQNILDSGFSSEKLSEIWLAVCGEQLDVHGQNFIKIMAENGRLIALPETLQLFLALKREYEKIVNVEVISAVALSEEQCTAIEEKLIVRLKRNVKLDCRVDETLIAGVVIRAEDLVIDTSVRGKLKRLSDTLQS